jgi:hypothetical protein
MVGLSSLSGKIPTDVAALDWLIDISKFAAGGAVALGSQLLLRRIERKDEPRGRDEFLSPSGNLPEYREASDLVYKINQSSLYILNADVRAWIEQVADALGHLSILAQLGQGRPNKVTWELLQTSRLLLGAMLRDEKIPNSAGKVKEYSAAIKEHREQWAPVQLTTKEEQQTQDDMRTPE